MAYLCQPSRNTFVKEANGRAASACKTLLKLKKLGDNMFGNKALKSTLLVSVLTLAGLTLSLQANAACNLVSTKDGSPLAIKAVATDTPEAKQFLETCVNPYTKMYMADKEAAKKGKREYNYNNCTGCHGGKLEGVMAPSLSKNSKGGQGDRKSVV